MTQGIKYIILEDKGLTVALRNGKHGYAKTHGGDSFDECTGKIIATKKLRIKELNAGISKSKETIKILENDFNYIVKWLNKEKNRLSTMEAYKEMIVEELHETLNSLGQ